MGLFDVHAHLTHPRFSEDVETVISRAEQAGVTTIICNGLHRRDNEEVLRLSSKHAIVRPALGLYPVDAVLPEMLAAGVDYPREDAEALPARTTIDFLRQHAKDAVAIGEIGLDHHWVPEPFWEKQERIFRELVSLAMEVDLPIIIHTRKAERRALEILLEMKAPRVNWHCYSSRLKMGRRIAEAGHFLSIPANARRNETFTGLLRSALREQLLLETDCPYLSPEPGTRNEPANVSVTTNYAAEVWGVSEQEARQTFSDNFQRLFGFEP